MKILGIDPGLKKFGLGLIENYCVYHYKLLKPKSKDGEKPLLRIFNALDSILKQWKPDYAFIEKVVYHHSVGTAILLGGVRGVTILALNINDIPYVELSPTRIKRSITLSGRTSKRQLSYMVKRILAIDEDLPEDIMDALACALAGKKWLDVNKIYLKHE